MKFTPLTYRLTVWNTTWEQKLISIPWKLFSHSSSELTWNGSIPLAKKQTKFLFHLLLRQSLACHRKAHISQTPTFLWWKLFLSLLPLHITGGQNKIFSENFQLFVSETVFWSSSHFLTWSVELCPIHNRIWSGLIQKPFTSKISLDSWLENQLQADWKSRLRFWRFYQNTAAVFFQLWFDLTWLEVNQFNSDQNIGNIF